MTHEQAMFECRESLRLASLRTTTFEQFGNMIRGLCFVLLRCPESMRTSVEACIINAERRMVHVALARPSGAGDAGPTSSSAPTEGDSPK